MWKLGNWGTNSYLCIKKLWLFRLFEILLYISNSALNLLLLKRFCHQKYEFLPPLFPVYILPHHGAQFGTMERRKGFGPLGVITLCLEPPSIPVWGQESMESACGNNSVLWLKCAAKVLCSHCSVYWNHKIFCTVEALDHELRNIPLL